MRPTPAGRLTRALGRFARDDRGAVVIDFLPVFFAVIFLVLLIFEISVAFYLNIASQKAAQLGARAAVTRTAVHADVPQANQLFYQNGSFGDACYQPSGFSPCLDPGGPWVCDGASLAGECSSAVFNEIVSVMRRAEPNLSTDRVQITYIYRQLGYAGGPFVPEVRVDLPAGTFGLFNIGALVAANINTELRNESRTLRSVSASAFGEDLSSID